MMHCLRVNGSGSVPLPKTALFSLAFMLKVCTTASQFIMSSDIFPYFAKYNIIQAHSCTCILVRNTCTFSWGWGVGGCLQPQMDVLYSMSGLYENNMCKDTLPLKEILI